MDNQFEFYRNRIDGIVVGAPVGEIDLFSSPDLTLNFADCLTEEPVVLVIRLDLVTFIDVAGLGTLLAARRDATRHGVTVSWATPSRPVRRLLDLAWPGTDLHYHATLRAALAEADDVPYPHQREGLSLSRG